MGGQAHPSGQQNLAGLWYLPPWVRRTTQARFLTGESLHGGPETSLHEAVKIKPKLCGTPRHVGDGQNHGPSSKKSCRQGMEPSREGEGVVGSKTGRNGAEF